MQGFYLPDEYSPWNDKFNIMLTLIESIWDGYLDSIRAVQQRIEPEKKHCWPVHSSPSHAGPDTKKFEKEDKNRMLAIDIITHANQMSPIHGLCLWLRNMELFYFVWTIPNLTKWRSEVHTRYHPRTDVSNGLVTQRYFCTMDAGGG